MEVTIGIIIALFTIFVIFLLIRVNRNKDEDTEGAAKEETTMPVSDCCGAHEVCDFDQIKMDETIIEYYDDEELDTYKNINENNYSDDQVEEFREVLYTLKTHEIRYWLLSIERREINLPSILQSEARMLMAEK